MRLVAIVEEKKEEKRWQVIMKRLFKNKIAVIGLIIVIGMILMATCAPLFTTHDPIKQNLANSELPLFSEGHWLGTDNYGRDVWSRIVYGSRISLVISFLSVVIGLGFGIVLGLVAGFYKKADAIIMRIMDLLFAFPGTLLAMLIIAMIGASLFSVTIAISVWSVPTCARLVRGSVLSVKEKEYVMALKSIGASDIRIMFKHILPNIVAPIIIFATNRMATAILSIASLSYLGLGAQPPTPEWGAMISQGQAFMWTSPHLTIVPGIAIMLVVFSFNVLGDGLRDALDPNMKFD